MDRGDGGGRRSSSRLRDRLARMFRPGTLLRSTCNNNTASASTTTTSSRPTGSASRALLAADARVDSSTAVGGRDYFRFSVDQYAPPPPLLVESNSKKKPEIKSPRYRLVKTMKLLSNDPYGFSSTSDDDDVFSSDDAKDLAKQKLAGAGRDTFFSSESSEFYTTTTKKKKSNNSNKQSLPAPPSGSKLKKKNKGQIRRQHRRAASSCDTCGVRDGFRPMVSAAEEKLRKGFAVVKRSRNPYADFRSSMVEMIVGKQLFGAPDLERLLRSYLSLNAPRHHPVILQAFSDIWVVLRHGG
jgi:uncharacterized protein (TIGR01568 family)